MQENRHTWAYEMNKLRLTDNTHPNTCSVPHQRLVNQSFYSPSTHLSVSWCPEGCPIWHWGIAQLHISDKKVQESHTRTKQTLIRSQIERNKKISAVELVKLLAYKNVSIREHWGRNRRLHIFGFKPASLHTVPPVGNAKWTGPQFDNSGVEARLEKYGGNISSLFSL